MGLPDRPHYRGPEETLRLSDLNKMLSHKCPNCRKPLSVYMEVRASFKVAGERWKASCLCRACGQDLTPLAAIIASLGRPGPARISEIMKMSDLWGA